MANSAALRRFAASGLLSRASNPVRSASFAPPAVRFFNTNAQRKRFDDDSERFVDTERCWKSVPFADVFDPLVLSNRGLSQMMERFMEKPRRSFDVKEDNDALFLRLDMPGLGKEDVKVSVEQNTLVIKGKGGNEEWESDGEDSSYSSRVDLTPSMFELGEVKAEMKNGVLKIMVPKAKDDEKKNVHQINVE